MADILSIGGKPMFDDRIVKLETHTYNPYVNTTFGHSDEIRIPIQQQDLYTLPCESFLYVEGKLTIHKPNDASTVMLGNNCMAFIFDEIRYELNGVEIDRNRNVGITSTLKNYVSLTSDEDKNMENAGWGLKRHDELVVKNHFNFCVPLKYLLGFCEDYKRMVINARYELILIRSRNDNNSLIGPPTLEPEIELLKVQWRMPHVTLNDVNKLSLLHALESGQNLSISFRSWDLYEYPLLQSMTKHSWAVKTAVQLEKPRYVVFALQTARKNVMTEDATRFDHCKLTNVKLFLNSEFYPYDDMNLDFDKNRHAILFNMYTHFRKSYYGHSCNEALFTIAQFLQFGPLVVIDCSRQNESIKNSTVDVRIEFDYKENVPANTTAYCLILHDRVVEYNPLTNVVRKIN
ncbi:uncharacterized protein LOC143344960 [Colletes latitarsis]|uniref:uncharacterized protein LOC143344960 n=1 Tax=Colletes latitarsis TaxID=2605962 RepID=UPI004036D552